MDSFSSDLALRIIQYLNVDDSGRLAEASQRYYYLVHQYRLLKGSEIGIATLGPRTLSRAPGADEPYDAEKFAAMMVKDCKEKLQNKPSLVLGFSVPHDMVGAISAKMTFPDSSDNTTPTIGLTCVAHQDIQVCEPGVQIGPNELTSLMAMNFPDATILPYSIQGRPKPADLDFLEQRLTFHNQTDQEDFWKAMILYAVDRGADATDQITTRMQTIIPNALIVGGVCAGGFVSLPTFTKEELALMSIKQLRYTLERYCPYSYDAKKVLSSKSHFVEYTWNMLRREEITRNSFGSMSQISGSGIFGVFLGGNVPVKSVVSRGVHSVLNRNGPPRCFSNLVVKEVILSKPGDDDYIFGDDPDAEAVHVVRKVLDRDTGSIYTPMELMVKYASSAPQFEFIGFKRKGRDGFQLFDVNNLTQATNTFVILTENSEHDLETLEGAELDFFSLNGEACMEDMDRTMLQLKQQTEGEKILGALIYTCNGRGPEGGSFIPEAQSDAKRFVKVFPNVPCTGFYAAGEYGPVALAGNENVFQSGHATLQGFTAVFALFIVPENDGLENYNLDDSNENVGKFVREQLQSKEGG